MTRSVPTILRILLGLIYVGVTTTGLLGIAKPPPDYPPEALAFGAALVGSGYLMYFVWVVQIVGGVALIFDLWTPLFLAVLAPVSVNVFLFHVFLTPKAMLSAGGPGVVVFVLNLVLLWFYRGFYRSALAFRARL